VLARAEFVLGLKELGNEFGIELPRGAGAPGERTARRLFRDAGMPARAQVAKTHFKTTRRITEQLF
jgi:ribonuclease HIII